MRYTPTGTGVARIPYGGASMRDAQNAAFSNNNAGPEMIKGTSYGVNEKAAPYSSATRGEPAARTCGKGEP